MLLLSEQRSDKRDERVVALGTAGGGMLSTREATLAPQLASAGGSASPFVPPTLQAETATWMSWGWLIFSVGLLLLGIKLSGASARLHSHELASLAVS